VNFDIWGSFLPLTAHSWDVQLARAAAYEKLGIFRASIREILKQNKDAQASQPHLLVNVVLSNLMTQLSLVEFYLAKMESYMRRKHDSLLKGNPADDASSCNDGALSTMSDSVPRTQPVSIIDEENDPVRISLGSADSLIAREETKEADTLSLNEM
jgi:hypothetical protein